MTIQKAALGSQGLQCGSMGFGCMGMTTMYGDHGAEEALHSDEIKKVFERARDAGITLLNSATCYGPDRINEKLIAQQLPSCPQFQVGVKVGTKGYLGSDSFGLAASPAELREQVESCLKILGKDSLDLAIQTRQSPEHSIEEVMGTFKELVQEGKVKYVGLSEVGPTLLRRAHAIHPVTCIEQEWSLWSRDIEANLVPVCKELGVGIMAYSPLGRGFLTGDLFTPEAIRALPDTDFRKHLPRVQGENLAKNMKTVAEFKQMAKSKGCEPGQLALAWLFAQAKAMGVSMVPIPGTKKVKYLEQNLGALDVSVSEAELAKLNDMFDPANIAGGRYPEAHAGMCFDPNDK